MLNYPAIDPVAVAIGPVKIHWYGIMYLIGFAAAWWLGKYRARRADSPLTPAQVEDLIFFGALGVVIGGRCGYVLFYGLSEFLQNPITLFYIWQGGMSFHGGLLGVMLALYLFGRRLGLTFFQVADFTAPLVPIGLGTGRLGNFIGAELWGRVSDAPWAMVFPGAGPLPRHPSQLYQFMLEGVLLFIILWWFSARPRPRMAVSGLFLLCYGLFRIFVEFFRQPDLHMGDSGFLLWGWVTTGQVLSLPMIILGGLMIAWGDRVNPQASHSK